eukprot:9912349-Lingulodinium_polyedra.AAC.1
MPPVASVPEPYVPGEREARCAGSGASERWLVPWPRLHASVRCIGLSVDSGRCLGQSRMRRFAAWDIC